MINVERLFIQYLNGKIEEPVSGDVPSSRPDRFVTVELSGGSQGMFKQNPLLIVQSWAESKEAASDLELKVRRAMFDAPDELNEVFSVGDPSTTNFPDLAGNTIRPRYQTVYYPVICG